MQDQNEGITASKCIFDNMGIYADYTIETKFPSVYDGLKKIARRIICVLHTLATKEGESLSKELTVLGKVVKMHPHGDQSIAQAISTLAQPFTHIAPLVFSDCNIGNYVGDSPAAARYVDVAEADIAKSLFFQDVNTSMFKMIPCESELGVEPEYLIPRIPTALLVQSFAIAIGYKTETFPMCVSDLCKMTKEYIRLRSSGPNWMEKAKALAKYTLPDFATECFLRNSKQLLASYKKGNYDVPIVTDGLMKVTKDVITFYTLPPGKSFKTVTYAEGEICALQKNSWESQNFMQMTDFTGKKKGVKDAGIMRGEFNCELRRGVNPFHTLATLKKKLQFTSNWKPDNHYVDRHGNMTVETPLSLMDRWYGIRYGAVMGDLKQKLNDMVDKQRRLLALIIVCDHTDEVYKIFKNSTDEKETIPKLTSRFGLSRYQAAYLAGLKFSQITSKGRDALNKELADTENEMKELHAQFHLVPEIMIKHVEDFEKKFVEHPYKQAKMEIDLSRRCKIAKYIGAAVYKGDGQILVEDEKEFDEILKDFGDPDTIEFKLFDRFGDIRSIGSDEPTEYDVPKYSRASYIDRIADQKYTACMCLKGGALIADGLIGKLDNMRSILPIRKDFIAVYRNGLVTHETVTDKIIRKNPSAGASMKDVVHIGNFSVDAIVVHANSSQANVLTIERVDLSNGTAKLRKIPVGSWHILGIYTPDTDRIYLNIPNEVRQRCTVRHIVLDHISEMIKPGERLSLVFGRNTIKSNFTLEPLRRKSTILLAKRV